MDSQVLSSTPRIYSRDQHNISRDNIDPDALKILYRLNRHGFKAYLVGGGVRDLLLGKLPKDFDITTDATPRQIKEIFRNSRIIGRRFKLVHIFFGGGKNIQVATFRDFNDPVDEVEDSEEGKPAHRLALDNKYGTEVTDAFRRDLTINGLFYDLATFSIIDYVGGIDDLQDGLIRIIGEPDLRFSEDPVRLIRVVRHAARTGFRIEEKCRESISKNKAILKDCSPMRIYEEVKKDLTSGACLAILRLLAQTELLPELLPELTELDWYHLSEGSLFSSAMKRADALVREGKLTTVSPLLALVAAVRGVKASATGESPLLRFSEAKEIIDHAKDAFPQIQIPKREREMVSDILVDYHALVTQGEEAPVGAIKRAPSFKDLKMFAELVAPHPGDDPVLSLLASHTHSKNDTGEEEVLTRSGGRKRPRRRRRRAPHHEARHS